jgi:hypothetical protein
MELTEFDTFLIEKGSSHFPVERDEETALWPRGLFLSLLSTLEQL